MNYEYEHWEPQVCSDEEIDQLLKELVEREARRTGKENDKLQTLEFAYQAAREALTG